MSTPLTAKGRYALVADPNAERGLSTATLLSEAGMTVVRALDGAEAVSTIGRDGPPSLLVTELSLPRASGYDVIRHLRAAPGGRASRLVILSAFAELRADMAAHRADYGIDAILGFQTPRDELTRVLLGMHLGALPTRRPMSRAGDPGADARRRASMERVGLTRESPVDAKLESLVRRVARTFGVSVALVSLVLEDRQWFKAKVGVTTRGTPRDVAFCRHAVSTGEPLVVPDAKEHPSFKKNRLVTEGAVRGYAGAPLIGTDGEIWGTLCIIDPDRPLDLNSSELQELVALAREVVTEVEQGALFERD